MVASVDQAYNYYNFMKNFQKEMSCTSPYNSYRAGVEGGQGGSGKVGGRAMGMRMGGEKGKVGFKSCSLGDVQKTSVNNSLQKYKSKNRDKDIEKENKYSSMSHLK